MPLLIPFLNILNTELETISGGELNVSHFCQEFHDQNVLGYFLNERRIDFSRDESVMNNYTGSFSSYLGSFFPRSYWSIFSPFGLLNICKKTLYTLYKQVDLLAYAMVVVVSLLMKVPEDAEATIALTTAAIALNGMMDINNIREALQKMLKTEQSKGLRSEEENIIKKYAKYLWPSLVNLTVITSALTMYGLTSSSSLNDTGNRNNTSVENSSTSKTASSSAGQLFLQYSSLLSSILLPMIGRKIQVSYLDYRKEQAGIRAQKHNFESIFHQLQRDNPVDHPHSASSSSHVNYVDEGYRQMMTELFNRISHDTSYLPFEIRTQIRELAYLQVRNANINDTLLNYGDLQEANEEITQAGNDQSRIKLEELGRQFAEYLTETEEALVERVKERILRSDMITKLLTFKHISENSIREMLERLEIEEGQRETYTADIISQQRAGQILVLNHLIK